MQNNDIPLINVATGPGSQPEEELVLDYLKMPSEMDSYQVPVLPEAQEMSAWPHALAVLEQLQELLATHDPGKKPRELILDAMPDADLDVLNQILGEGEVSIVIEGTYPIKAQETVMAGVWRVRFLNAHGDAVRESLEVADVPACVRSAAYTTHRDLRLQADQLPARGGNAPSVIVEISEACDAFDGRQPATPHVINLSLLPFSPQDHQFLAATVGSGVVSILSRGYGNCRITSTEVNGLWRVQYFNSTDQLILDTLEITDIPLVACAAQEDLVDSAERLKEIREVLT